MSEAQKEGFEWLMTQFLEIDEDVEFTFHHGDCVGWDAWANNWVKINFPFTSITHSHPGYGMVGDRWVDTSKQAHSKSDIVEPMTPYSERNEVIAFRATHCLIAAPEQNQEILRSGTWSTVRCAHRMGQAKLTDKYRDRPIYIVRPFDGMVVPFGGTELAAPKGVLTEDQRKLFVI